MVQELQVPGLVSTVPVVLLIYNPVLVSRSARSPFKSTHVGNFQGLIYGAVFFKKERCPQTGLGFQAAKFQGPGGFWAGRPGKQPDPAGPFRLVNAQGREGARGELLVGNPCYSSSVRHRRRGPTTPHHSISAVVCCVKHAFSAELPREAKGKKASLEGVWGMSPKP